MMRKFVILMLIVGVLVGCAKAGDPVTVSSSNEVLVYSESVPLNGYARDVEVYDDYIFVAEDNAGISIVDRVTLDRTWITSIATATDSRDLVDVNNIAYDSERKILAYSESKDADQVIYADVSDIDNPVYLSYTLGGVSSINELKLEAVPFVEPENDGDHVPLLHYTMINSGYFTRGALGYIYFEGIETNVQNLGFLDGVGLIPVVNTVQGYDEDDEYFYFAGGQRGITIMSKASTEANIIVNAELDLPGEALDVVIIGNYLYVACRQEGIKVIDVTDRNAPVIEPVYERGTTGLASDLSHEGDYLALASTSGGVYLFDVSDPSSPSYIEKDSSNSGYTYSVSLKDGQIFAGARDQLVIFDIR